VVDVIRLTVESYHYPKRVQDVVLTGPIALAAVRVDRDGDGFFEE
jgi:hypothetical protein